MSCQKQAAKERPIIFSGESVRAILDGRKTQTRRVVNPDLAAGFDPPRGLEDVADGYPWVEMEDGGFTKAVDLCLYGKPGDLLWVRETWAASASLDHVKPKNLVPGFPCQFRVGGSSVYGFDTLVDPGRWRPSIHMPRWACRLTLEVTDVRVERVQDISEEDAIAEGLTEYFWSNDLPDEVKAHIGDSRYFEPVIKKRDRRSYVWDCPIKAYRELWNDINAKRWYSWASNPWVWVIEFKRAQEAEGLTQRAALPGTGTRPQDEHGVD